jgi:hypothetical protein
MTTKKFLAVYTGTEAAMEQWKKLDEAQRKARAASGLKAWAEWATANAAAIVDEGNPVGKTKRVSREGISDIRNNIAAYVVVQAESHEAAARLFEKHPHFMTFPGDAVEIMEFVPIPGK